ncbi:GntR family transcriptional regulator [Qipengyuania qiaonensis]|uniref:GntR family transcriptional regulator n=1 Tax=Qipengyuania qiaonensis TaxID=2867240 RepID=A0ABS7J2X8_9SPHN|nr:GntR family transcriptional regulator [Qipengyuania qiaonensis]MBX7481687.1 GntR family transcriptional regulator [Qipengyuania qiaonensis]
MSPAHVLEPTYERLKRELMSGRWPQETRLEAQKIAEDYGVSATPVRDCLNRLTGEGLVVMRPGEGYRVPRLTEKAARDMLALHHMLVMHALAAQPSDPFEPGDPDDEADYAGSVNALFGELARRSDNGALVYVVWALGERLHSLRTIEPAVIEDAESELARLREACIEQDADLAKAVAAFHDRRLDQIAALVAALP